MRSRRNTENRDVKTKKKMKIEICHFDGTGRNILIFHTKNGGGKLIFLHRCHYMVYVYEYKTQIEQTLKNGEFLGSKGELSETQITLHIEIEFACNF